MKAPALYQLDQQQAKLIPPGATFPSQKALCEFLKLPYAASGNSKIKQLKDLTSLFDLQRSGNQLTVHQAFNTAIFHVIATKLHEKKDYIQEIVFELHGQAIAAAASKNWRFSWKDYRYVINTKRLQEATAYVNLQTFYEPCKEVESQLGKTHLYHEWDKIHKGLRQDLSGIERQVRNELSKNKLIPFERRVYLKNQNFYAIAHRDSKNKSNYRKLPSGFIKEIEAWKLEACDEKNKSTLNDEWQAKFEIAVQNMKEDTIYFSERQAVMFGERDKYLNSLCEKLYEQGFPLGVYGSFTDYLVVTQEAMQLKNILCYQVNDDNRKERLQEIWRNEKWQKRIGGNFGEEILNYLTIGKTG